MSAGNRPLAIDQILFMAAFGIDVDYRDMEPQFNYLDKRTGDVIWVYESDDDAEMNAGIPADENRQDRERVAADPERYLEVPGLDHGEHHDILKAFLRSDWTDDEQRIQNADTAYFGSIGGWKENVNDRDAVHAYYDFRDQALSMLAEDFLRANGIAPIWR